MERNVTLDFIRGVAILGILLLNISAFGLPKAAYLNPALVWQHYFIGCTDWAVLDLFAQVKFLTLFALLFGAGLQMLLPRGKRWISRDSRCWSYWGLFTAYYSGMAISCWRMA